MNFRRLRANPRLAQQILGSEVCMCDPRILAQMLGSEVCTAKSSDGLNPYFACKIYVSNWTMYLYTCVRAYVVIWYFRFLYLNIF